MCFRTAKRRFALWGVERVLIKPTAIRALNIESLDPTGDHTRDSPNMQAAIDKLEAKGGGLLLLGPGTFHLSASPLVGTGVHIMGQGRGTVLRGYRPTTKGHALIYNKGYDQPGYSGAHDFGISHVTVDTPDSNGITFVHASNVYLSHIYGLDAYHHIIDIGACQNVIAENIFITGESGTAPFQIDALPSGSASKGWDGNSTIDPNYDGTGCDTFYLKNAIITATVRSASQNWSIHLHKIRGRNIYLHDITVGNTDVGIYQDAATYWDNLSIKNVCSDSVRTAISLLSSNEQSGILIDGCDFSGLEQQGILIGDRTGVTITNTRLSGLFGHNGDALWLRRCKDALVSNVTVECVGSQSPGAGIRLGGNQNAVVSNSIVKNFEVGLVSERYGDDPENVMYGGLLAVNCASPTSGNFAQWTNS